MLCKLTVIVRLRVVTSPATSQPPPAMDLQHYRR
jgi:hypothetical protein